MARGRLVFNYEPEHIVALATVVILANLTYFGMIDRVAYKPFVVVLFACSFSFSVLYYLFVCFPDNRRAVTITLQTVALAFAGAVVPSILEIFRFLRS
jgi:hypothetical protein